MSEIATLPRSADPPPTPRLLIDFLNTADRRRDADVFTSREAVLDWCVGRGLLGPDARVHAYDVPRLVNLREGLRDLLGVHTPRTAGEGLPDPGLATLNELLAEVPLRLEFDAVGAPRLVGAGPNQVDAAIGLLLDAVARAVASGEWERVKVCAYGPCRRAFRDTSRNRSGRWCAMANCGNLIKMRRAHQ